MFCERCSAENVDTNSRCRLCGLPFGGSPERKKLAMKTPGYSGKWINRYRDMKERYEMLKDIEASEDVLKGFRLAMKCFEDR